MSTPGGEVQAASRCEISHGRRGVFLDDVERTHHVLIAGGAPVGQVDRQDRDRGDRAGDGEVEREGHLPRPPLERPRCQHDRNHHRGEYDQVTGRVGHGDSRARQQQRRAPGPATHQAIDRQQRQRQAIDMNALHVREAGQRVGVEGEQRSGEQPGEEAAGPGLDQEEGRKGGQRESGDDHQVVNEHGRRAGPRQRGADQRRDDQRFREGERIVRGVEDIGFEQMGGIPRELVRDPRQDPLVELRVGVVIARVGAGVQ